MSDDLIFSYSRKTAIQHGTLIDVSETAREAGFRYPVAITHALWHGTIVPDQESRELGQDEQGRLWDLLMVLRVYAKKSSGSEILFPVIFVVKGKQETVKVKSVCSGGDEGEPVITIMEPQED